MSAQAGPSRLRQTTFLNDRSPEEENMTALVARLSLQEIDEFEGCHRADRREGPMSDAELALSLVFEDARSLHRFNSDRAIALSLSESTDTPEPTTQAAQSQTLRPATVMHAHPRVNGDRGLQVQMPPNLNNPAPTIAEPRGFGSMIISVISYFLAPAAPSGPPVAASVPPRPSGRLTGQNCVICQDPIRGVQVRAPCGHYYGISCAKELFEAATRDESLFPPRCCRTEISFAHVRPHLTAAIVTLFTEKQTELATPNRVYCAKPSCSRFLGPRSTGFFAWPLDCPAQGCNTRTCPSCKGEMGSGRHECKVDETDEQILALGRTAGWARCPRCAAMIELNLGCFHMTCRCRAEFCYLCTARWKTCACTQWDETRLVAAAEERVAQQFGPVAAARPNQIVRPVQRPQENRVEPMRRAAPPAAPLAALLAAPLRRALAPAVPLAAPITGRRVIPTPAAAAPIFITTPTRRAEGNAVNVVPKSVRVNIPPVTRQPMFHEATAAREAASALRERRIREAMEELRVNHDCSHTKWKYRAGGGPCQTCSHRLPNYLFRCLGCQTLACNRCRRNRL